MNYPHSLPSCLMPEAFNGSGDFEDYLQQFNTCAQLSGWYQSRGDDLRPQYFALRLKGNALHFFSTLNYDQQNSFAELVEAFRQNYTTNVDILKARLKAAKQQPGQDIATFLCDVRTLDRRAYRDHPDLIEQTVLTSFIEGLSNSTLRWELRKARPYSADTSLTLAIQLNSYLELEGINSGSSTNTTIALKTDINQVVNPAMHANTVVFDEFVRALKRDGEFNRCSNEQNKQNSNHRSRNERRDYDRGREDRNCDSSRDHNRNQYRDKSQDSDRSNYRNNRNSSQYDSRDNSRSRYGQRHDSNNRKNNGDKSVRFSSRERSYSRERDSCDDDSYRSSQRTNSPYRRNRDERSPEKRQDSSQYSRNRYDPCRHCQRTNHASRDCKACFNCHRIGHRSRDCRAPRRNTLN